MTEEFKNKINLANTYYNSTVKIIKLMRASRDYANLNESIANVYDNLDKLINNLNILNEDLLRLYEEEKPIDEDYASYLDALSNIGYALMLIDNSKSTYEYVYKSINNIEKPVSAKKKTKVSAGKVVNNNVLPIINSDIKSSNSNDMVNVAKIYTKR